MFDFDPQRLRFLMDREGINQTELAQRLAALCEDKKPKPSLVWNWLNGQEPRFGYVTRLAYIFKVQPDYFAGNKGRGAA